jgi:hypothetical protein
MRRGAEFYRYPLLPLDPASIYDAPGDTEARPVTVNCLIFRFDGSKSSAVKVICDGVVVETV